VHGHAPARRLQVQVEDVALCEAVQRGLADPSYHVGRYAPSLEAPMHSFHRALYADVMAAAVRA
jgi:choline monooxygenase